MTTTKILGTLAVLATLLTSGCAEHFTTQEAYSTCEQLADAGAPIDSEEAFANCVSCYEDCGNACVLEASTPAVYACPDDSEEGEGGGAATGGGAS